MTCAHIPLPPARTGPGTGVRFYAQREVHIRGAEIVHAVTARATPMIEFIFGDRIRVHHLERSAIETSPGVVVVDPQTHRGLDLQLRGALEAFVIMFQPDGLHRLFSIPMRELTDQTCEAHSILGGFSSQVHQRLGDASSFDERVRLVDQLLLRQSLRSTGFDGISAAAHRIIQASGRVEFTALAGSAGLGVRQFERRFIQQVDIRTKLFARIAGFEAALDSEARFAAKSWTNVAHEFGYYDQMHMVHYFAEFASSSL